MFKYDFGSAVSFTAIPSRWQTVIASVEFQYGSLQKKCPSFWAYVIKQYWDEAITELKSFGDRYSMRRKKEASYAEQHA